MSTTHDPCPVCGRRIHSSAGRIESHVDAHGHPCHTSGQRWPDVPLPDDAAKGIHLADTLDEATRRGDPTSTRTCTTGWCDEPCDGQNHNRARYTTARLTYIDPGHATGCGGSTIPNVGVAVRFDEEELPAVVVHILGAGVDAEADLTWHEAVQLYEYLDEAITILGGFLSEGFALESDVIDPKTMERLRSNAAWVGYRAPRRVRQAYPQPPRSSG